jgi:hypothetical protein
VKPHFRLLIAHNSTHGKRNVLQCEFIRYLGMANSKGLGRKMLLGSLGGMMRIVCKWLRETFGGNGLIFTLFVLAAGDRLGVDLGAPGETEGTDALMIVSFNWT